MKKKSLYIPLIALLTVCLTTSCSKDNHEEEIITPPAKQITNKPLIEAIEASAKVTFTKDTNGNVDVAANKTKIDGITELNIEDVELASSAGIEYFTELTTLGFYNNKLKEIDITQLTKLISFRCDNNQLTTLDVTKNTALTTLSCLSNQLTTLDLTKNTALEGLKCTNNQLVTLDLPKTLSLISMACEENNLTTLDISANTQFFFLRCNDNRLKTLDITQQKLLKWNHQFYCGAQTSDGVMAQNLTLEVTEDQLAKVDGEWKTNESNKNVTIAVK